MKRLTLVSLCLLALVGATNAAGSSYSVDLYNNLATSIDGSDSVSALGPLAASFSTGPSGYLLTMVGVVLKGDPSNSNPITGGGGFLVALYADGGGVPDGQLLYLNAISDYSFTDCTPYCEFDSFVSYPLAPNTRYWIQISDDSIPGFTTSAQWAYSNDTTAPGVGGEYHFVGGVSIPNDGAYQSVVNAVPVPELGSLLLLTSGLAGVFGAVRRRLG